MDGKEGLLLRETPGGEGTRGKGVASSTLRPDMVYVGVILRTATLFRVLEKQKGWSFKHIKKGSQITEDTKSLMRYQEDKDTKGLYTGKLLT